MVTPGLRASLSAVRTHSNACIGACFCDGKRWALVAAAPGGLTIGCCHQHPGAASQSSAGAQAGGGGASGAGAAVASGAVQQAGAACCPNHDHPFIALASCSCTEASGAPPQPACSCCATHEALLLAHTPHTPRAHGGLTQRPTNSPVNGGGPTAKQLGCQRTQPDHQLRRTKRARSYDDAPIIWRALPRLMTC